MKFLREDNLYDLSFVLRYPGCYLLKGDIFKVIPLEIVFDFVLILWEYKSHFVEL